MASINNEVSVISALNFTSAINFIIKPFSCIYPVVWKWFKGDLPNVICILRCSKTVSSNNINPVTI